MIKQKHSGQSWWPVYALALMLVGLLFLAHRLAPSPGWRTFLEVGDVLIGYGLITWWLEKHPDVLLDRPAAEADSPTVESPEGEMPSPLSAYVEYYFYASSEPIIIYRLPDHPSSTLRLNGHHHPVRSFPALPEEIAKPATNN